MSGTKFLQDVANIKIKGMINCKERKMKISLAAMADIDVAMGQNASRSKELQPQLCHTECNRHLEEQKCMNVDAQTSLRANAVTKDVGRHSLREIEQRRIRKREGEVAPEKAVERNAESNVTEIIIFSPMAADQRNYSKWQSVLEAMLSAVVSPTRQRKGK
jgi:DNA-directed RNA polymerase beta subunit